jgi:hypothetical protein
VSEAAKSFASERPLAVVVPNDLKQAEQQAIIDACGRSGIAASLLWLPVAAALAWLADNQGSLPPATADRTEPLTVFVVHADWGHISLADLQLVPWPSKRPNRWVPARRNPAKDSNVPGFGWQLEARASRKATVEKRWQTLFSTPNPGASGGIYEFDTRDAETLLKSLQGWDFEQQDPTAARRSVEKWLMKRTQRPDIVIVLGDWSDELATLERLACDGISNSFVCLAGEEAESYLARGAAIFKSRQLKGEVCYLDSLPQLEMLIERRGEYVWYPLLRTEEEFVPGGLEWSSPEAIDVAVRKGERDVKLVVWHEEYSGIRELTARLEEPAVERIPGALHVSATPAQGNAVLRIDLLQGKGRNRQSIVANWKRMRQEVDEQGKPHTRDSYLESLPRSYPEPLPRLFSQYKWAAVREYANRLLKDQRYLKPTKGSLVNFELDYLKSQLLQKDTTAKATISGKSVRVDATAVSSEGKVPDHPEVLNRLQTALMGIWRAEKKEPFGRLPFNTLIRAIAYTSIEHEEFEEWLIDSLRIAQGQSLDAIFNACAHCLRNPQRIRLFVNAAFQLSNRAECLPKVNALKAVSQVFSYRVEATRDLSDDDAYRIIRACLTIFKREMDTRAGKSFAFRWSSVIIVYLLRRRIFQSDFLPPDSPLAMETKVLFSEAIERYRQRKLKPISGSVDTAAAIKQMIDYIDRKGVGPLVLGLEGDDSKDDD